MSKINPVFTKKNLGDHFLERTFFLNLIFEPLYFLKLRPIFDELIFLVGFFFFKFLGGMLILGQKTYLLGPNILKIPQPN